jgi:hypothetical protein
LTVTNCTFNGTSNGIRLKSAVGRGGIVENLTYSNLTMTNVPTPVSIESYYPNVPSTPASSPSGAGMSEEPTWENITISGLTSVDNQSGADAGILWGLPDIPISNVSFINDSITAPTGMEINFATGVSFVNSKVNIASSYDAQYTVSVPEPGSLSALFAAAATCLCAARWRGRRIAV